MNRKIACLILLFIFVFSFVACDPEQEPKQPEESKTSISVSLVFQEVKEQEVFSVKIDVSKDEDVVDSFTLTSEENEKTIEVEEGEYLVEATLLQSGEPLKDDSYSLKLSEEKLSIKEGDEAEVVVTVCPGSTDPKEDVSDPEEGSETKPGESGEGESESVEGDPEIEIPVLTVDLCNYFKDDVKYEITSASLAEPLSGVIKGNTSFIVPAGYYNYTFTVESETDVITTYSGPVDQPSYTSSITVEEGKDNYIYLYVYRKSGKPTDPVLIFNPSKGAELLGVENQYGDTVSIVCDMTRYTDNTYSSLYGTPSSYSFTDDSSHTLPGSGYWEVIFTIDAKDKNGNDVSDKYRLNFSNKSGSGERGYIGVKYSYYHLDITRDE